MAPQAQETGGGSLPPWCCLMGCPRVGGGPLAWPAPRRAAQRPWFYVWFSPGPILCCVVMGKGLVHRRSANGEATAGVLEKAGFFLQIQELFNVSTK